MSHDEPPLPKLEDSVLDDAGLDAFFERIQREGEGVQVLLKGDVHLHAHGTADLLDARALLREGKVFGVQIRCRLAGSAWLYTLMQVPQGVRLVGIEQQW